MESNRFFIAYHHVKCNKYTITAAEDSHMYSVTKYRIHFNETASFKDTAEKPADQIAAFSECNIEEYVEFYNLPVNWSQEIINAKKFTNPKRTRNRIFFD